MIYYLKREIFITDFFDKKEGFYFGFHDLPELSDDDSKYLVQKLSFDGRMPKAKEFEGVGYLDVKNNGKLGDYHELDKTFAWNYHKGCRLQWYGKDKVIFNTFVSDKLVAEIVDINTKQKSYLDYPIDTVSPDCKKALTFSYERLQFCMPGYGYPYQDSDSFLDINFPKQSGLFVIDLSSGKRKLLISLYDLAMSAPDEFKQNHMHYVTHSEFSHDGRYISFLHRWIRNEGSNLKRWTRIMVYDTTTGKLHELPSQISGSHYVWNKRHQLLASCTINNKDCHVLFDMNDISNYKVILPTILNQDGHQTFIDDENFITDTYPNNRRMAQLYKVSIPTKKIELIADTYSPKKVQSFRTPTTGNIACYLHPRMSKSGKYLTFDSPTSVQRSVCILKIK